MSSRSRNPAWIRRRGVREVATCLVIVALVSLAVELRLAPGSLRASVAGQAPERFAVPTLAIAARDGAWREGAPARVLRVCADPNNLPFSNDREEGFENALARLLAREMGASLEYTWWAQRRGFFRNTLGAGLCDLVMGVPADFGLALTTRPYYRSSYVFVTRRDGPRVRSLDDPVLRRVRVGVQLIGDDGANTPPAHALAARGIVANVAGYPVAGDYREANPPARIVEAVASGEVDVAIVWGPLAGYFATRQRVPLDIAPVPPERDPAALRESFDIALGVRRGDEALRRELDAILVRRRSTVDSVLAAYGVPRADRAGVPARGASSRGPGAAS
jgi:mxaJ protein